MMMTEKRPVGRPRTTLNDIPENWEELICDAAQNGASDVELRCLLGVSKDAWNTLKVDYPEFSSTVKACHDLCQVWWERCGRKMSCGEAQGNATTWIFNMKNRFGWNDKAQTELTVYKPKSLSDFYDDIQEDRKSVSAEDAARIYMDMIHRVK